MERDNKDVFSEETDSTLEQEKVSELTWNKLKLNCHSV